MKTAMEADRDDKHRVRRWYISKGIDENKEDEKLKDSAEADRMTIDEDEKEEGNESKKKAQDESEGAKRRRKAEREAEAKRKQECGKEQEAKIARNNDIEEADTSGASSSSAAAAVPLRQLAKKHVTDVGSRRKDDNLNSKKSKLFNFTHTLSCLNFTKPDMKGVRNEIQVREVFVKKNSCSR